MNKKELARKWREVALDIITQQNAYEVADLEYQREKTNEQYTRGILTMEETAEMLREITERLRAFPEVLTG